MGMREKEPQRDGYWWVVNVSKISRRRRKRKRISESKEIGERNEKLHWRY